VIAAIQQAGSPAAPALPCDEGDEPVSPRRDGSSQVQHEDRDEPSALTGLGLLSDTGRALLGRLAHEDASPDRALTLSAALRREYPPELVAAALTQHALRVAARAKFSHADEMLFTRPGLEQASSEVTARHAAARFSGLGAVADLCCGIGGNLVALAEASAAVIGVDSDLTTLAFARHNAAVCAPGRQTGFACADVTRFPLGGVEAVFIDPARRTGQRRLPAGQYRPALEWCLRLAGPVPAVGIKAAPGLRRNVIPPGWETEFVAVGGDLKEALLWSPALATANVASRATVLPSGDTLTSPAAYRPDSLAGLAVPLAAPGAYLLDPSPAVTRAGLVADLARSLGAWQIDPMIAFLSSDEPVRSPFARTMRVLESAPWHEKRFARRLRELGIGSADIRRRGLAGDVDQIHRRLDLRGDGAATVVLTRVDDRPWGLICTQADAQPRESR
jgi:SAM-dependent methyltransferase